MHGNKACCEDVYQTAATVSILVLVICFASTQRTDGQASGVSANELARRILYERIGSRTTGPKPLEFPANGQTEADEVVETQKGELKPQAFTHPRTKPKGFMPCKEVSG